MQHRLATARPEPWDPFPGAVVGGCFVCFGRGGSGSGSAGDPGWAASVTTRDARLVESVVIAGEAGGPYLPGLLSLREGRLLDEAVRALPRMPDVLLVNATGRDHPLRAGLAVHLGAVLDLATVGVTHRPLLAHGGRPPDLPAGAASPLFVDEEVVGAWVRTRPGARPVAVTAGWRTGPEEAVEVVRSATGRARTPEPIRQARRLARMARSGHGDRPGRTPPMGQ
ncbi:MAG: endonuclease V [Acidimicrobiia bacterium]